MLKVTNGQTIEQALQEGITAHKEWQSARGRAGVIGYLQSQLSHPDANHNLGVMAVLANKTDTALRLFQIALEANPNIEQYWHSYVDTLVKTDQLQTAKKIVKMAEGKGFDTKKLEALLHQSVDQTISQGPS